MIAELSFANQPGKHLVPGNPAPRRTGAEPILKRIHVASTSITAMGTWTEAVRTSVLEKGSFEGFVTFVREAQDACEIGFLAEAVEQAIGLEIRISEEAGFDAVFEDADSGTLVAEDSIGLGDLIDGLGVA